jgi:hypothetical protein
MSVSSASRAVPGLILGALSLLSAFLLFQVQPIISKFILPWFGGSPGVWTTCMVFFQIVLFAGYAYAHGLTLLPRRWQGVLHGALLAAAVALLPIAPGDAWKPAGAEDPTWRILLLLAASVGLPYFVLSSTSPLVQVWFTRSSGGSSPWRLYALSNVGSLAALLSYPLFFEVRWDVLEQTTLWAVAFGAFVILSLAGIWLDRRHLKAATSGRDESAGSDGDHPGWGRRAAWLLLPALASSMLLGTTNHVCQDVAVIPFLWVVPLSLYLLTFIICFEHERWYARVPVLWALPALPLLFFACSLERLENQPFWKELKQQVRGAQSWLAKLTGWEVDLGDLDLAPNYLWELGWAFGAMFFACMICHGELTRLKPAPRRLTEFYLLMSAGGALGGLFVSLAAPHLFSTFAEWPLTLVAAFALAAFVLLRAIWRAKRAGGWWLAGLLTLATGALACGLAALGMDPLTMIREALPLPAGAVRPVAWTIAVLLAIVPLVLVGMAVRRGALRPALVSVLTLALALTFAILLMGSLGSQREERLERVRNFYGTLAVEEDTMFKTRSLINGGVIHGMQQTGFGTRLNEEPTAYFGRRTGVGRALESLKERDDARVGVVGMGAGTVACYAQRGHTLRFYDINPDVVRLARKHFTFLADAERRGAKVETVISDARLALEREEAQHFDVLLLDAFSGDSVPVHLLTREAFAIYQRHLKPDGIIVVHVTNSFLVIAPVIEKIAADAGFKTTRVTTRKQGMFYDASDYVLVTNNRAFLERTPASLTGDEVELNHDVRLWTDRYHNLLGILEIPSNVRSGSSTRGAPTRRASGQK